VVKARQIVRPHDPHKAHERATPFEEGQGARGKRRRQVALEGRDLDARIFRQGPAQHQPLGEGGKFAARLQRITRRHQPPDLVKPKPFENGFTDLAMGDVGRIERAAEEADALAWRRGRQTFDAAKPIWSELRHQGNGSVERAERWQSNSGRSPAERPFNACRKGGAPRALPIFWAAVGRAQRAALGAAPTQHRRGQ
jgi:hypothetical protein